MYKQQTVELFPKQSTNEPKLYKIRITSSSRDGVFTCLANSSEEAKKICKKYFPTYSISFVQEMEDNWNIQWL